MILANIINKESNHKESEFIIFGKNKKEQEIILKWLIWISLLMIGPVRNTCKFMYIHVYSLYVSYWMIPLDYLF